MYIVFLFVFLTIYFAFISDITVHVWANTKYRLADSSDTFFRVPNAL